MKLTLSRDLTPLKIAAKAEIDAAAEAERLKHITDGAGQQMAYQQKYLEAKAYLDNPAIEESAIPHLVAEVGITGDTVAEVAGVVVYMRNQWLQLSAQIEQKRLAAKMAVDLAATPTQISLAKVVNWAED